MEFFIRKYLRGVKSSGTNDVWVSSDAPEDEEFERICNSNGVGKYNLCVRGKGIRGFRKIKGYFVEDVHEVFNAETIGVKHNVKVSELSSEEILTLMGSMINKAPNTPEGQQRFMADMKTFQSELANRNTNVHSAEQPLVSAGFPAGGKLTSFVAGAITGGVIVWLVQKKQMDELKGQINSLETQINKAEEAIEKVKKKAESIEKKASPISLDQQFLAKFHQANGWRN
jgi:hypothetical protein